MGASGKAWVNLTPGKESHIVLHSTKTMPFSSTATVMTVQDVTTATNPRDFTFDPTPIFKAGHPHLLIIKLSGLVAASSAHPKRHVESGTVGDTGLISITLNSGSPPVSDVPVVFVDDLTSS
jgi:hypothetical protein